MNGAHWSVLVLMGLLTYALRAAFILPGNRADLPTGLERALRFVPVAVLPAIIVPALIDPLPAGGPDLFRLLAGAVAAVVAWRSKNIVATLSVGMGTLWLARWLLG